MSSVGNILRAERLKFKRTFGKFLSVIAPGVTLLLAFVLTGGTGSFAAGAWNWWYAALLPGALAVMCYLSAAKDRKNHYSSLKCLPISSWKLLLGKMVCLAGGLLTANVLLFAGTAVGGAFLGTTISMENGAAAAVLLTLGYLWEIPLCLFLSMRFGMFADIFVGMVISIGGLAAVADKSTWWLCPTAIPPRLMCPVLNLLPNGLPVPAGSPLRSPHVIFPGVLLSLGWLAVCSLLFVLWFDKAEVK